MSLMQLLTNGKTLVDLKHSTNRYHMPSKNFLPKFGPAKNPFTAPPAQGPVALPVAAVVAAPAATVSPIDPPVRLEETQRLPLPPAKMKETKRLPFVAPRQVRSSQPAQPVWWETWLDRVGVLMSRGAGWWTQRKAPVQSAGSSLAKPVIQGELSLENIKVVRNDLSDADLEVVPARTLSSDTNFKPALQPQSGSELVLTPGSAGLTARK